MRTAAALAALLVLTACNYQDYGNTTSDLPIPAGVTYELEPVGTGTAPSGILLRWISTSDPAVIEWHVYSRASAGEGFSFRGSTTSPSFHDAGAPFLQYYVVTADQDGFESAPSAVVTVDERLALARPSSLASTSLDGALALAWSDNAYLSDPSAFANYRVYGAHYDLDAGLCEDDWALEGTTVAPEFVVGAISNGVPRCFAVTAVSVEGYESLWSPVRDDTPRPDARNVIVYARQAQDAGSGFRFWQDLDLDGRADANELGLLKSGSSPSNDPRDLRECRRRRPHRDRLRPAERVFDRGRRSGAGVGLCLPDGRGGRLRPVRGGAGDPRGTGLPDPRLGVPDGSREPGAGRPAVNGTR